MLKSYVMSCVLMNARLKYVSIVKKNIMRKRYSTFITLQQKTNFLFSFKKIRFRI